MAQWGPIRFPDYSLSQYQQPKQQHQFVVLYQLPKGMESIIFESKNSEEFFKKILGRGTNPTQSMLYNTDEISDFLTLSTVSIGDSPWQVNQKMDEGFFNGHVATQGRRQFQSSQNVTFREYTTSPITRIMKYWQTLQNDSVTHNIGYMANYKGLMVKLDLDPNVFLEESPDQLPINELLKKVKKNTQEGLDELDRVITRQVVYDGVWPMTIPEPGSNYSSDDSVQIQVQFSMDRYYDDIDWRRFLGSEEQNISTIIKGVATN